MRNTVIYTQFNHFRVNQKEFHFFRVCLIQNACNQCIDADTLTTACCAGNEQVRHFRNVCDNGIACNIFPQRKSQFGGMFAESITFQHCPQIYGLGFFIWHFNAYCRFTGNRCFNTNAAGSQIQSNVVCQIDNLADLNPLTGRYFISCNGGTCADIDDAGFYTETFQCHFQFSAVFLLFQNPGATAIAGVTS